MKYIHETSFHVCSIYTLGFNLPITCSYSDNAFKESCLITRYSYFLPPFVFIRFTLHLRKIQQFQWHPEVWTKDAGICDMLISLVFKHHYVEMEWINFMIYKVTSSNCNWSMSIQAKFPWLSCISASRYNYNILTLWLWCISKQMNSCTYEKKCTNTYKCCLKSWQCKYTLPLTIQTDRKVHKKKFKLQTNIYQKK